MEVDAPLVAPSERKHGIPDPDMIHAFNRPIFVDGLTMFVDAAAICRTGHVCATFVQHRTLCFT